MATNWHETEPELYKGTWMSQRADGTVIVTCAYSGMFVRTGAKSIPEAKAHIDQLGGPIGKKDAGQLDIMQELDIWEEKS